MGDSFSKLKGKRPEKIEKLILEYREGMEISSFLSIEIKEKEKQLREFVELQNQLPELVTEIRNNLVDYYKYRMSEISNEVNELESNLEIIEGDLEQIDSALVEMESNNICVEEHLTIADLTIVRNDKEKELEELGSEKEFKQSLEKL